jgi:hypothetical protein
MSPRCFPCTLLSHVVVPPLCVVAAETLRQETEKLCERSMVKTREGMKRQVEDINATRSREVKDARAKAAALAG